MSTFNNNPGIPLDNFIIGSQTVYLPIEFRRGLGYSPASGPSVGGTNYTDYNPMIYSSTFFGSRVKEFMIPMIKSAGHIVWDQEQNSTTSPALKPSNSR
jgi:hypothetical protein